MTKGEAVNWLINLTADIGKAEHRDLWHYEQALCEIRDMLESDVVPVIRCKDCKHRQPDEQKYLCMLTITEQNCKEVFMRDNDYCSHAERRTDET